MKKVAIITAGVLPVPATKGGAVENLTEILLKENEKNPNFEFTLFPIHDPQAEKLSQDYKHCKFRFIKTNRLIYRIFRALRFFINRVSPFYFGNQFIASWRKYFPDYEIKRWDEESFDVNTIPIRQKRIRRKIILKNIFVRNPQRKEHFTSRKTPTLFIISQNLG